MNVRDIGFGVGLIVVLVSSGWASEPVDKPEPVVWTTPTTGPLTAPEVWQVCHEPAADPKAAQNNDADTMAAAKQALGEKKALAIDWLCRLPENWTIEKDAPFAELNAKLIRDANTVGYYYAPPQKDRAPSAGGAPGATQLRGAGLESALLWGLADFMVKRAKLEADTWLLEKLKDKLCATGSEYAALLERTCPLLKAAGVPGSLGSLTTLRAAIRADFKSLPATAGRLHATKECAEAQAAPSACDAAVTLSMVGSVATGIADGRVPIDALLSLDDRSASWAVGQLSADRTKVADAVLRGTFLLQTMVRVDGGKVLIADLEARHWSAVLQAGLVNLVESETKEKTADKWVDLATHPELALPIRADKAELVGAKLEEVAGLLESLKEARTAYAEARALKADGASREAVFEAWGQAIESTARVLNKSLLLTGDKVTQDPKLKAALLVVERHAARLATYLAEPDHGQLVVELASIAAEVGLDEKKLPAEFRRVLSFIADVAQAKDTEEVEAAIESLAAPPHGYKGKRSAKKGYLRLNGYLGGFLAFEDRFSLDNKSVAPWLPIGLEAGVGLDGCSLGLLVHVIDIGALGAYRFDNADSDVESAPEVRLKQVFSPGLFAVLGFKNAPISLAVGMSVSPALRTLKAEDGEAGKSLNTKRYGVTVAFDIPLFP